MATQLGYERHPIAGGRVKLAMDAAMPTDPHAYSSMIEARLIAYLQNFCLDQQLSDVQLIVNGEEPGTQVAQDAAARDLKRLFPNMAKLRIS